MSDRDETAATDDADTAAGVDEASTAATFADEAVADEAASDEKTTTAVTDEADVSRETLIRIFGEGLPLARRYARTLAADGLERGLIGPREVPRLWERHLLNCVVLAEIVAPGADVVDVGSGAGLPGLPLAIARPDLYVTLVEPMERRTAFLTEVVEALDLPNVAVVRARAEDVTPKNKADVVTSRAVAPLGRLAGWCLPLVRPGGEMLAIKGASAEAEIDKYAKEIRKLKGRPAEIVHCGAELLATPTTVVRVVRR